MRAPDGALCITDVGAPRDGSSLATAAIQRALDMCGQAGGGTVVVPPGRFVSGALFLRSRVHLHVAAGALLAASQRPQDFPPIRGRWEGLEQTTHSSLITGIDVEDVAVTGRGTVDGQGMPWWAAADATRRLRVLRGLPREAPSPSDAPLRWPRPRIINLVRCRRSRIAGLVLRDAPSWSVHLLYCEDASLDGLSLSGLQAYDCCGVIVDSSRRVGIANCLIAAGADCIAIKSGYNEDGRRVGIAAQDITITNCNLTFANGSGVALGSETAGGIRNVIVENCVVTAAKNGVAIRSPRGRGGVVERIRFSNLVVDRLLQSAVLITNYFDSVRQNVVNRGEPPAAPNPETERTITLPVDEGTPTLRDIEISHLTVGVVPNVVTIEGLPERPIERVRIHHVQAPGSGSGVVLSWAREVSISGLAVEPRTLPAVSARHVEGLNVHRLRCAHPPPRVPLVQLEHTSGVYVHACHVGAGAGAGAGVSAHELVKLEGDDNRELTVADNDAG